MIIAIPTNNTNKHAEIPGRAQNAAYVRYVAAAGYTPVLVPMESDPAVISEMADGLLLAGGIDIDPIHYGVSNYASFGVDPEKDASERALFHAFREYKKPIFGICRGFQLIFRELLHAHEENEEYNEYFEYMENIGEHAQTGNLSVPRRFPSHQVRANVKTLYGVPEAQLKNNDPLQVTPVNSMHHQAVVCNYAYATRILAEELAGKNSEPAIQDILDVELLAWSMRGVSQPVKGPVNAKKPDFDNYWTIVEAAQIKNWGGPIMGVQWHPEELGDIRVIRNFFGDGETKAKVAAEGN